MNKKELAALLNNRKYKNIITEEEKKLASDNDLVVVYGYSDDVVEITGAFDTEAYDMIRMDSDGILPDRKELFDIDPEDDSNDEAILDFLKRKNGSVCLYGNYKSYWTFSFKKRGVSFYPAVETFNIYDECELYCIGVVFHVDDL